jgi:hypothetical protein
MLQQWRLQSIPLHLSDPSGAPRQRIANLRKMAGEFRRLVEQYGPLDRQMAERLLDVVRELEEEVARLERDDQTNN